MARPEKHVAIDNDVKMGQFNHKANLADFKLLELKYYNYMILNKGNWKYKTTFTSKSSFAELELDLHQKEIRK